MPFSNSVYQLKTNWRVNHNLLSRRIQMPFSQTSLLYFCSCILIDRNVFHGVCSPPREKRGITTEIKNKKRIIMKLRTPELRGSVICGVHIELSRRTRSFVSQGNSDSTNGK